MTEKGEVSILSQSRPQFEVDLSQVSMSGGLALHHPGVLCWSDVTSVHCGQWTPGQPIMKKLQIVKPEQVAQVCGM